MCRQIKFSLDRKKYGDLNWSIENKAKYKEFMTSEEAHEWGVAFYQKWADEYKLIMEMAKKINLSPLADAPIECYCGYSFRQVNQYLRNGVDNEFHTYKELSDILAITLCSAPKIPCNIIVYRIVCNEFIE